MNNVGNLNDFTALSDFAFLPDRWLDKFRRLTGISENRYEVMKRLGQQYLEAISAGEDDKRICYMRGSVETINFEDADKIYIVTDTDCINNKGRIVLLFKPNSRPNQQPWELINVITEEEYRDDFLIDLGNVPSKMLLNFAYWPNMIADYKELKNLCLPENWSFVESPTEDDFPILKSYIQYTFAKLWKDRQVFKSANSRYVVFNTGLVNKNFKYIFMLFEKHSGGRCPWKFIEFCMPGIGLGGRLLADNYSKLPTPARYFSNIADVSYILAPDKTPDEQMPDLQPDHYFIDHPDRLPKSFLLDGCRKCKDIVKELEKDISHLSEQDVESYWHGIGDMISAEPDVYDDLEAGFRNAVRKAVMRVSWNYRTAIPIYFPTREKMSILLPLSFLSDGKADVALVVERNDVAGNYSAPTILSLATAYANARLVCKPESDWLNQRMFSNSEVNTGEDNL